MAKILTPKKLPVDALALCEWNCNEMGDTEFAHLTHIMDEEGFDEPLHVVPMPGGDYLVIGGEHRYKAAIANGLSSVPCYIIKHLEGASEAELQLWSVRRNNLKGKQIKEKYTKIEQNICKNMDMKADIARKRMLVRANQVAKVKKTIERPSEEQVEGLAETVVGGKKSSPKEGPATDGERDKRKSIADRTRLLADAKAFQQECLVDSADTVDHGYLYVGQNGKSHLIVDSTKKLYGFISAMVRVCKKDSAKIDDFLASAIKNELSNWD